MGFLVQMLKGPFSCSLRVDYCNNSNNSAKFISTSTKSLPSSSNVKSPSIAAIWNAVRRPLWRQFSCKLRPVISIPSCSDRTEGARKWEISRKAKRLITHPLFAFHCEIRKHLSVDHFWGKFSENAIIKNFFSRWTLLAISFVAIFVSCFECLRFSTVRILSKIRRDGELQVNIFSMERLIIDECHLMISTVDGGYLNPQLDSNGMVCISFAHSLIFIQLVTVESPPIIYSCVLEVVSSERNVRLRDE